MATTYLRNTKLAKPSLGEDGWDVPFNYNADLLDGVGLVRAGNVATKEYPSTTLQVHVGTCAYRKSDGSVAEVAGAFYTLPADSYVIIYILESTNLVTTAAADVDGEDSYPAWPITPHVPLARVETGTATIEEITDRRVRGGRVLYSLVNAVDDAAAATASVAQNCLYRTGSVVKVRIA